MNPEDLERIVAHLRPDYGFTRVETQGKDAKLLRRKFDTVAKVANEAMHRALPAGAGLYFSPHGYNDSGFDSTAAHVGASRCLYHDIDLDPTGYIVHEGREPMPCYTDKATAYAAALAVCDHTGIPHPTAVIDSGRGLHLYWRLAADVTPDEFVALGTRMKAMWTSKDTRLAVDTTRGSSPGELMRLPGSVNQKSNTYVWLYEGTALRPDIDRSVMEAALPIVDLSAVKVVGAQAKVRNALGTNDQPFATAADLLNDCQLFAVMWSNPAQFAGYEAWRAAMMIMQSDANYDVGLQNFHTYCAAMPNYDAAEITKEFEKASFRGVPVSCPELRRATSMPESTCHGCPVFERHPSGGTCMKAKQIRQLVANVAADNARMAAPEAVTSVTVPTIDLTLPPSAFELDIPKDQKWYDVPMKLPRAHFDPHNPVPGYFYDDALNLIRVSTEEEEVDGPPDLITGEVKKIKRLVPVQSVIYRGMFVWIESKVLANLQGDANYANVWAARGSVSNHQFTKFEIPLSDFNDIRTVTKSLLSAGLALQLGMEKALQGYLTLALAGAPDVTAATRFGWAADKPTPGDAFVVAGTRIAPDAMRDVACVGKFSADMVKFKVRGDFDEHLKVLKCYSAFGVDAAKLMIAASVASPLYHALEQGALIVSITGTSGSGKSKLLRAIQSFWGFRDGLQMGGGDTANAVMAKLGMSNGIGGYLDEVTNMPDDEFGKLAMMATSGREKARLDSSANLRPTEAAWNLPVFCTSNQPLHGKIVGLDDGADAARARVMDVYVGSTNGHEERTLRGVTHAQASAIDHLSVDNTGFIGAAMVQFIVKRHEPLAARLRKTHNALDAKYDAGGRFAAAFGALAIEGNRMLGELFPGAWLLGETEMRSIVDRMLAQSARSRDRRKLDPAQIIMAAAHDLGDRVVRFTQRQGRPTMNADGTVTNARMLDPTAVEETAITDWTDAVPAMRMVMGAKNSHGQRGVLITVTPATLSSICLRHGITVDNLLFSMAREPEFEFPKQPGDTVMVDMYEGMRNGPQSPSLMACHVFHLAVPLMAERQAQAAPTLGVHK